MPRFCSKNWMMYLGMNTARTGCATMQNTSMIIESSSTLLMRTMFRIVNATLLNAPYFGLLFFSMLFHRSRPT